MYTDITKSNDFTHLKKILILILNEIDFFNIILNNGDLKTRSEKGRRHHPFKDK